MQLISWVIGVSLTRTVTNAVQGMYEGTQRIAKGDFSWRIPVNGNDQLAELGNSFNNMTAQIEKLVVIAKEKERLQSEVEIAGEVQNQLFPRAAPSVMRTIELVGVCEAARMVSGDYYDYLCLPDGNLALAIGDVAGKENLRASAAAMASIQSIMRTQPGGWSGALGRRWQWSDGRALLDVRYSGAAEPPALRKYFAGKIRHIFFRFV